MALFDAVPAEAIRAAQIMTGAVMALWLGVGFVPALQPYAARIRAVLLAAYLLGGVAFVAYALVGR